MKPFAHIARTTAAAGIALAFAGVVYATAPVTPNSAVDFDDWVPVGDVVEPTAVTPAEELRDLLGGVDFVPTADDLDPVLGDGPAGNLLALATADADMDPGVRLRAFRALEHYPEEATVAVLIQVVTDKREVRSGVEVLYLHAAMRSLGTTGGDAAVEPIRPLLDHDNKDTRAAAAAALGATGSKAAKDWLYERLGKEPDPMVRLALSDAIRRLDEKQQ